MSGTYTFAWNGDYPSDTDKACKADGSSVDGTNSGGDLSTDYGVDGSVGVYFNTKDEYIAYSISSSELDEDEGTLWVEVYIESENTYDTAFFEVVNAANAFSNQMTMRHRNSNNSMYIIRNGGGASDDIVTGEGSLPKGSWVTVGITWSVGRETYDLAASTNKGSNWTAQNDGIATMANAPDVLRCGNLTYSSNDNQGYRINRWAVVSGWQGACPW